MSLRLGLAALLMLATACAPDAERAAPPAAVSDAERVVTSLMTAFNDHDPDEMRQYWHGDVVWF